MSPEFQKPEYVHVVINHLPIFGTAVSALVLLMGILFRSRPVQMAGCFLVMLTTLSYWPVANTGEDAYDRVKAMSNVVGKEWLEVHGTRADKSGWVFYTTAALAAVGLVMLWKKWKWSFAAAILAFLFAAVSVGASFWIASAGGKIRHSEFRSGPPSGAENASHSHGGHAD